LIAADNPEGQARLAAFQEALQQLGWSDGRNVRIDTRWGEDIVDRTLIPIRPRIAEVIE